MNQTASLYLKLPLKPAFHLCVFVIFGKIILCSFKLNCFWKSRPSSSTEGSEGGVFSKAPDWKPLFSSKTKIKQNTGCWNKEYNAIFEYIHQSIRTYPRRKKSTLINNWETTIAYWQESCGLVAWWVKAMLLELENSRFKTCKALDQALGHHLVPRLPVTFRSKLQKCSD